VSDEAFGVYVHVPFCRHRCDYCAFATWDDRHHLTAAYLHALEADLEAVVASMPRPATSVFVGGGTPSMVGAGVLGALIASVPLADGAEVTVEVNPEDATVPLFEAYVDAGVNRISFGVQSFSPTVLSALGRRHRPETVEPAVSAARTAGIDNVNVDLIYGAAGETADDWRRTVDDALALEPSHVSAYALTVEAGTPLADQPARHPDDDDQAAKYVVVHEAMEAAGLQWYEISNWASPGRECRHNQLYWSQGEYLGVGCSAHSHLNGRRWWNIRTPERYIDAVEAGRAPVAGEESLDPDDRRVEGLQLALRTSAGVPATALSPEEVDGVLDGLVERRGQHLVLTVPGRLLANEVAVRLR
jgi:putative oxygen-independent coproporphyrinogen III oxidase